MRKLIAISMGVALLSAGAIPALPAHHPQAEEQALDLAKGAITLRSVRGPGNQAPEVAALFSHGLNERIPIANIPPSISYFLSLFADLSK